MLEDFVEVGDYGEPILFNWSLIDECQFKCSYCYSTDFNKGENFKKGFHQKSYELVLQKLKTLKTDWTIDIQGGEPTLHPKIVEIIGELEKMQYCKKIVLATNLTAKIDLYKKLDLENTKLSIHISYHAEYHLKIFKKINKLYKLLKNVDFFVEVILYPKKKYYDQMLFFLKKLEEENIPFGVNLVYKNKFWDGVIEEDFYKIFEPWIISDENKNIDSSMKLIKHKTKNETKFLTEHDIIRNNISYKGYKCQSLSYNISINGDIFNTCTLKKLPFIFKESDVKKTVICPLDTCSCTAMLHYKKIL